MDSLTEYIKKAFEYKDCGDYKTAIDYFYKALALENDSAEILKELAYLYSLLCQYDRAISLYEQVCNKEPNNYSAKYDFALLYKKLDNIVKAKELFYDLFSAAYEVNAVAEELFSILLKEGNYEQIISAFMTSKQKIDSSLSLYFVGIAYSKMDFPDKAEDYYNRAFSLSENNIGAGYNLAKILYERELYSESEKLLFDLLKRCENDKIFYLLAEISYVNKKMDEAIKYYAYAIKLNSNEAEYFYKLGIIYSLKGFMDEAEQSYCRAVTIESDNVLYNYTLAYFYYTNKKMLLAEKIVDYLLSLDDKNVSAMALKSLILLNNNEIALAKNYIEKIDKINTDEDLAFYAESVYFSKLSLWEKAINSIKKAIVLNSDSLEYKYELAKNYFSVENLQSALVYLNEIIDKNDKYIQAHILKAKIMYSMGDYQQAQNSIDAAMKLDINCDEIYFLKGCMSYNIGNYDNALENFKIAVSISPEDAKNYAFVGMSYYMLENYVDAYSYFKEAAEIDIANVEYRYYMAKCSINNNDVENAVANFSVLRRLAPNNIEYAQEYADYLNLNGKKKAAINVLKSLMKSVSSNEEKDKIKKIIENFKKGC